MAHQSVSRWHRRSRSVCRVAQPMHHGTSWLLKVDAHTLRIDGKLTPWRMRTAGMIGSDISDPWQ